LAGKVYLVDLESVTDPRHVGGGLSLHPWGLALKSKDPGLEAGSTSFVRESFLSFSIACEHVIETVALLAEQLCQENGAGLFSDHQSRNC